jgi:hypothetical protein
MSHKSRTPEEEKARQKRRDSRKRSVRPSTIAIRDMGQRRMEQEADDTRRELEQYEPRPTHREECGVERPCPYVSCKYHLYLDVSPKNGSIKLNFPDLEVWELPESCALDVAEREGMTLESVAELMNLTRERVRQIESKALERGSQGLAEYQEESHGERDVCSQPALPAE